MTAARRRLRDRRLCETFTLEHAGLRYTVPAAGSMTARSPRSSSRTTRGETHPTLPHAMPALRANVEAAAGLLWNSVAEAIPHLGSPYP
jgi:hypothetical protein